MLKKIIKMTLRIMIWAIALFVVLFGIPRLISAISAKGKIFTIENAKSARAAIVFGAGLQHDKTPSPVLKDRISTAVQLYRSGKVEKILLSGDNRFEYYNEPASMKEYALSLGVPEADLVLDFAGRRTYDTCYRAKEIFGLKEAILVTQRFHLPRAIFTCGGLGMQVTGVEADLREYNRRSLAFWNLRETAATTIAVWQVWVSRPLPVLGDPEPIFPENK